MKQVQIDMDCLYRVSPKKIQFTIFVGIRINHSNSNQSSSKEEPLQVQSEIEPVLKCRMAGMVQFFKEPELLQENALENLKYLPWLKGLSILNLKFKQT